MAAAQPQRGVLETMQQPAHGSEARRDMIVAERLGKRYRDTVAIDQVSFNISAGEVVGLLGPNGAGKSTTMRILTGCLPPTEGRAITAGYDVFERPLEAKRQIGYLPEVPPLYPELAVREQLELAAALKCIPRKRRRDAVEQAISQTDVSEVATRLIAKLSRGYRQRVGIAQALIGDPPVLVMDEPTAGLDPHQIGEVRALIGALAGHHTVVLSTHILQEVAALCQRVLIIARGRIVADATLEALREQHAGLSLEQVFLTLTEG